jgi:acyl-CoA synthetase (AMP-forming)/AMP-acid ligase II
MEGRAQDPATGTAGVPYVANLMASLARRGSAPVLRQRDRDVAASALAAAIFRYARALAGLGIEPGKLVAMFAPNNPDAMAVRYAANLLGAAAEYLSVPGAPARRAELLRQTRPDLLVLFSETVGLLPAGVAVRVATVGCDSPMESIRLDALAAAQPDGPVASRARPDDLCVIVSSGGTTGVPKGSWRNFGSYTAMVQAPSAPARRQLVNGHLAFLSQVLVDTTLLGGGTVVLRDSYDPAETLAAIEAERITDLFLVEPQLFELMDHPDVPHRDLSSLKALVHIGASAPPTLRRRARQRLGPVIAHTYGASEMGLVSLLAPAEHDPLRPELLASAGRIRPGVEIRFRGEDGGLAAIGESGVIEVRSPAMAGGYRNRPEQQAVAFQDGWYHTGDLGRLDAGGYLRVLGRAVDIGRVDGRIVTPTLIEDVLCRLPSVRYAVLVMGWDSGRHVAAIVPGTGHDPDVCREAVAAAFGPELARALLIVPMERVPTTEQGKPDREAIRALG